jgi:hypothetical protein
MAMHQAKKQGPRSPGGGWLITDSTYQVDDRPRLEAEPDP